MKLLICTWSLTGGGAERVASIWASEFVKFGYAVDFLLGSFTKPISYKIPKSCNIFHICPVNDKVALRFIPKFLKKMFIRKTLSKSKPDIIISVMPDMAKLVKDSLKVNQKIPIIITEHNSYDWGNYTPMPDYIYNQKFDSNLKYNATTVLTKVDYNILKEKGQEFVRNTFVLPNPVSFDPLDKIPPKRKTIVAAGRLDAWKYKGFDTLLNAWSLIESSYQDWSLQIAGNGDKKYLLNLCKKLGLKRVKFLGFVNTKECFEYSSIFVLSSRYEGFGMVLLEAMSQGCACIACDHKGRQSEIITNQEQGCIIPPDNPQIMASAIKKLIDEEEFRNNIQKGALSRSRDYMPEKIVREFEKIIFKVIKYEEKL